MQLDTLYKSFYDSDYIKLVRFALNASSTTARYPRIAICFQPYFEMGNHPNPLVPTVRDPQAVPSQADLQIALDVNASPTSPTNLLNPSSITGTPPQVSTTVGRMGLSLIRFALGVSTTTGGALNNGPLTAADMTNVARTVQAMLGESSPRSAGPL